MKYIINNNRRINQNLKGLVFNHVSTEGIFTIIELDNNKYTLLTDDLILLDRESINNNIKNLKEELNIIDITNREIQYINQEINAYLAALKILNDCKETKCRLKKNIITCENKYLSGTKATIVNSYFVEPTK